MENILFALLICFVLQAIFFLIAYSFQTDKFTDFTYSLTFILISLYFYLIEQIPFILFLMILAWGVRLGSFLVFRTIQAGKDQRFDQMRSQFFRFMRFWIIQGTVCFILSLPIYFFTDFNYYGIVIALLGFIIETIADFQKYQFKFIEKNESFISSGLWKYARHPNYFGEILVWTGIFISTINSYWYISIISPITIFLILRYLSGVPLLEKNGLKKWGKDQAYLDYLKNTRMFIPIKKFQSN